MSLRSRAAAVLAIDRAQLLPAAMTAAVTGLLTVITCLFYPAVIFSAIEAIRPRIAIRFHEHMARLLAGRIVQTNRLLAEINL